MTWLTYTVINNHSKFTSHLSSHINTKKEKGKKYCVFFPFVMRTYNLSPQYLACKCAKSLQSYLALFDPMDGSASGPLSMGLSRQEYWRGLPCSPPGDLPNPGIKPMSLMSPALAGGSSYQHYSSPNSRRIPYTHRQFQHP